MEPTNNSSNVAGLVLSGGGAFGAYEVGVIKALCVGKCPATAGAPLDAGVFAGTSVGGFNAAIMAMNKGGAKASAELLEDIWLHAVADNGDGRGNGVYRIRGDVESYLDPRVPGSPVEQLTRMFSDAGAFVNLAARSAGRALSSQGSPFSLLTGLIDLSVVLNTEPFEALVKKWIEPDTLRQTSKQLSVVATNWGNGDPEDFDFREMRDDQTWDAIRASAAIPGLFPPVTINGQLFIDGGVVSNTPIKPAINAGATEIHVVSLDPEVPGKYTGAAADILSRVYMAMVAANISEDIESARWVNQGLEILARTSEGAEFDSADGQRFLRAAARIQEKLQTDGMLPRKIAIHRYYPRKSLGGLVGMLNFGRTAIEEMIQQGYDDTCAHKCTEGERNTCII